MNFSQETSQESRPPYLPNIFLSQFQILESSKMTSNALNKETDTGSRAERMVLNIMNANEGAVKNCQSAKKASKVAQDDETENLMVERITAHQKAIWMLRSTLK